jgi:hypothetical protein
MTEYKQAIDGLTGENVYIRVNTNSPKVSKNARRKARRYGKTRILSAHASSNKDSSGTKYEFSQLFHARRQCQSPEMILIHAGY